MPEYTENINLEKPTGNENFRRQNYNDNMDKIDAAIAVVEGKANTAEENANSYTDVKVQGITAAKIGAVAQTDFNVQTAIGTNALIVTTTGNYAYIQGKPLKFKAAADNTGNMTINVDNKGVVPFLKLDGNQLPAGAIKNGKVYECYYDSSSNGRFFLLARATGSVVASKVLAGETFSNDTDTGLTGTMPDKTAAGLAITPSTADQVIPQGYYPGSTTDGKVKGDANLVTGNIKSGAVIFGVAGKASVVETSDAACAAANIQLGKTAYINGTKVTGTMPDKTAAGLAITPSTADQAIPQGYYPGAATDGIVKGDVKLVTGNIKSGVSIFGVNGSVSVVDTADATAAAANILSNKTAYANGSKVTGTMLDKTAAGLAITPSTADQVIPQGYYPGSATDGKVKGDANLVTGNIKSGAVIFGVAGKASVVETSDAACAAANIQLGKTAYINGTKVTGTMPDKTAAGLAITPGTADQAIPQGYYPGAATDGKVKGDANLVTGNIKSGVSIFGVNGAVSVVDTADATVAAANMLSGKTAYVNGTKVTGAMPDKTAAGLVITPGTADQAIPQGYYPGTATDGKVKGDANLIASNVRDSINLFGIIGTLKEVKWAMQCNKSVSEPSGNYSVSITTSFRPKLLIVACTDSGTHIITEGLSGFTDTVIHAGGGNYGTYQSYSFSATGAVVNFNNPSGGTSGQYQILALG